MINTTLYNSYLKYFACAKAPGCQPMSPEIFQQLSLSLSATKRELWAKKFRKGFEQVVLSEAVSYRNAFGDPALPAKAA
jgi:hypothetical protein